MFVTRMKVVSNKFSNNFNYIIALFEDNDLFERHKSGVRNRIQNL